MSRTSTYRGIGVWAAILIAVAVPLSIAATSPLLQWRGAVYIGAGLAGVAGLALLLVQPLSTAGRLPGVRVRAAARVHAGMGAALLIGVAVHVGGLFDVTPPDVVDALLFRSPTPFFIWGVVAICAVVATAALAFAQHRRAVAPLAFRAVHLMLAFFVAVGIIVHALLIEGTMESASKIALCILLATVNVWILAPRLQSEVRRLPTAFTR